MYSTITNPNIEIVKNHLKIDTPISKGIPSPLPGGKDDPRAFAFALVGSAGSGKSTLANSLLSEKGKHSRCYYKRFHHCYFICPKTSLRSLPDNHPLKSHPEDKIYEDFDEESLTEIMERVEENVANNERSLLFCDDIGSRLKQNRKLEKLFSFLLQTRRHRMMSFMITLQTFNDMSLSARKNISHCAFWRPTNRKEGISIWSEILPVSSREELDALFDFVYDKPHQFLYVKLYSGSMYKNFMLIKSNKDASKESVQQKEVAKKVKGHKETEEERNKEA